MSLSLTRLVFLFVAAFVIFETGGTVCRKGFKWNTLNGKCELVKCGAGKKLLYKTGKCVQCRKGLEPDLPKCCGTNKLVPHARIINGETTKEGGWPWLVDVTMYFRDDNDKPFDVQCVGALISHEWVLTAANCVSYSSSYFNYARKGKVALGIFDKRNRYGRILSDVSEAFSHFGFNSDGGNDIALVKLKSPPDISSSNLINPICLPVETIDYNKHTCYVAGWSPPGNTKTLEQVEIPILNQKRCKADYKDSTLVNDDMLCAGGGKKGVCLGDIGNPLICEVGNQWHVVGILSRVFNNDCDVYLPRYPDIYTRVTSYLDWIRHITK